MNPDREVSLRDVGAADVYLDNDRVATLARQGTDEIAFSYLRPPERGESVRRQSVSWSLSITETSPVLTNGGAVPPFFAGLLPEGVRLGVVTASTKTSIDDHLTLLLAVGSDAIGNVRVVPGGESPPERVPLFDPLRDTDFRAVFRRLSGAVEADPVALPGVQPKVSAAMWSTPTRTSAGPAILKLAPLTGFPRLIENEHFFLRMAAACGIRVPRTQLLHDMHGEAALLVARFDRDGTRRIAQEDACQVAGLYPASKYRIKAETALSVLADACARGGGSRPVALLEFLRMLVFAWLIGNGDLHGKNVSIYDQNGYWQPTPAYDLVTTQPYTGWRDPMAMTLYGRANRLRRSHFLEAGERLGLRGRAVNRMIDLTVERARPWTDRCTEIGFDERITELLQQMLVERLETLS